MSFVINPYAFGLKGPLYEDDFSGVPDSLVNGRSPNLVNVTGNTFQTSAAIKINSNGQAVSPVINAFAVIRMPENLSGTIVAEAGLRPRNNINNFMAIGFTSNLAPNLTFDGAAWAYLRGGTHSNAGMLVVNSGNGVVGELYKTASLPEVGFNGANVTTVRLTYNISTGNLRVELGSNLIFEGVTAYNGVANTPVPLSELAYFCIQWQNQLTDASASSGYCDFMKVSIL